MQHYKAPDNSLHCIDPEHAHLLPAGCVPITDEEAEALRPKPDAASIIEAKLSALRQAREAILNRLAGIAFAAQLTGDTATAEAFVPVRQGLLEITDGLKDIAPELIDATVMQRYALLVQQCTPAMVSAFAQVDA